MFSRYLLPGLVFSMLLVAPEQASAHAVLLASSPAAHSTLKAQQVAVHLKFNSRIDAAHSRLYLVGPAGRVETLVVLPQQSPDSLSTQSVKVTAGAYTVRWQALAGDGHITRGEIPFTVQ